MPQAAPQSTTRRTLFAAAPAIATVAAADPMAANAAALNGVQPRPVDLAKLLAEAEQRGREMQDFIWCVASKGPDGRRVAQKVFELGYAVDDVIMVWTGGRPRSDFPEVWVEAADRPGVAVVIGPHGVREERRPF